MGLDDQFNKNDGTVWGHIDAFHRTNANYVLKKYQDITGRHAEELRQLTLASAAGLSLCDALITGDYQNAIFIPLASLVYANQDFKYTALDSEIGSNGFGLPKNLFKGIIGVVGLVQAAGTAIMIGSLPFGFDFDAYNFGLSFYVAGLYMTGSRDELPPPKPKKKKALNPVLDF